MRLPKPPDNRYHNFAAPLDIFLHESRGPITNLPKAVTMSHTRPALRILVLMLAAILLGGCAAKEEYEFVMPAGSMVAQKNPRKADAGGEDNQDQQARLSVLAQEQALLEQLDRDNQRLNSKLDAMLAGKSMARRVQSPDNPSGGSKREQVEFQFLNAEISEVIKLFMDYLGDNYILHPGVAGRVSFQAKDELTHDELVDFLLGLLRINGLVMFYENDYWQIMPLKDAPRYTPPSGVILPQDGQTPKRGQLIQAYRMDYVSAAQFTKVIQPFLSKGALMYGDDSAGILLLCDYPHTLIKVQQMINLFDVSVFADTYMQAYSLRYATAEDVSAELKALAESTGLNAPKGPGQVNFLALERLNMVLVVSKQEDSMEFIDLWIHELDREIPQLVRSDQTSNVFVYYVQNGSAEDIVTSLEGIFEGGKKKDKDDKKKTANRPAPVQPGAPAPPPQTPSAVSTGVIRGELTGEVAFVVDEPTNAILTKANGMDYKTILKVIEKLDIYPKQCLIEVVIAEVGLTQESQLGIDWNYLLNGGGDSDIEFKLSPGTAVNGTLAITATAGDRLTAALNTLASEGKSQILSAPHILASNHKEAKIDIGQEVPILTQTTETVDTTDADNVSSIQQNIQYRNTGILLSVTPHINEKGLVRLELSQEISSIDTTNQVEGINSPTFEKRLAETEVIINDAQTIVIGGLMQQQNNHSESNVPVLRRIPLLKYLFGTEAKRFENSELLIFITPHVVERQEDNDFISKNFIRRLQGIKRDMLRR